MMTKKWEEFQMKKIIMLALAIILTSCAPSEAAIQTAIS